MVGLFEVLITNMMLFCGANNNFSFKHLPITLGENVGKPGLLGEGKWNVGFLGKTKCTIATF